MEKQPVTANVPSLGPISNAVVKNGHFYAATIPVYTTGSFETGDFEAQAQLSLDNLRALVEDAGGSMTDITQVTLYVTSQEAFPAVNSVWQQHFTPPYPNRATIVVKALAVPGLAVELVAVGQIDHQEHT